VRPFAARTFAMTMASHSTKRAVSSPGIPDRLYFKIGDVAQICGVETYVLRFWETQFPQLKPNKSGTGQRLYRKREVELALDIKRLVHEQGYTIAGARQALGAGRAAQAAPAAVPAPVPTNSPEPTLTKSPDAAPRSESEKAAILRVKSELREIAAMLTVPPTARRERPKLVRARPDTDSLFPM
jgi:DNA-binding transcriptional MerR regulator